MEGGDERGSVCYDGPPNETLLKLFLPTDEKVLDLGCGAGANARALAERGLTVDGVSFSRVEADAASRWCRSVSVHDLESGLPASLEDRYDVVLASHVLEHLRSPAKLLDDTRQLLSNSDGRLIVGIPNLLYYKNRYDLLRGRFEYEDAGIMDASHYKWYSFAGGRALLERHGFDVVRDFADGHAPLGPLRRAFSDGMIRRCDAWFSAVRPGLFGYQLVYVAKPRRAG